MAALTVETMFVLVLVQNAVVWVCHESTSADGALIVEFVREGAVSATRDRPASACSLREVRR